MTFTASSRRRMIAAANLLLLLVGLLLIAAQVVWLASRPGVRRTFDATKTRAYSLSDQTRRMLEGLTGPWSITVVVDERATDPAVLRQVDEVLERFETASPALDTARLDPSEPRDMARWEALLDAVEQTYATRTGAFRGALDQGLNDFATLRTFCAEESAALDALLARTPAMPDPVRAQLEQLRQAFAQLAEKGGVLVDAVREMRTTSPGRPIADDEGARSALVANHAHWSEQLTAASAILDQWARADLLPEAVTTHARTRAPVYASVALLLRRSQDELARLPALELSEIGRQISSGEVAIVLSPDGAAVVPSWQLFPSVAGRSTGANVTFDRRFRGEQVIAGAIRSLLEPMPMVVFVHGENRSLLRPADDRMDLAAAADALRSARFDVREWTVSSANRPVPAPGQAAVWVIVPPLRRTGLELSTEERTLLQRTTTLIEEGQPVLLTVTRSALPLFRQEDPWAAIASELGVRIDTGRVLFEWERIAADKSAVRQWQSISAFERGSDLGSALEGQALVLSYPTAIELTNAPGLTLTPIARVQPSDRRWLESDWRDDGKRASGPPVGATLEEAITVVVAAERARNAGGRQRLLVVGSGAWLLSSVMDIVESLGGDRAMLTNPGNRELLLSGVTWLAGMDEWIAPGPTGREIERLAGITPRARGAWMAAVLGAMPIGVLALAAVVAWRRRSG